MATVDMKVTSMSLRLTTNCEGCGELFTFESNDIADIDGSRWPKRCESCRLPHATVVALPKRRRGKR